MHTPMKKAQNAVMCTPGKHDFALLLIHSKVRRGSSADGTQGLKAHKMAPSFCSKFKDNSHLLKTKEGVLLIHPPISHSPGLPSDSTSRRLPCSGGAVLADPPLLPRRTCHAILWLCLQTSSSFLLHCHELHTALPHSASKDGWWVKINSFIFAANSSTPFDE